MRGQILLLKNNFLRFIFFALISLDFLLRKTVVGGVENLQLKQAIKTHGCFEHVRLVELMLTQAVSSR